MKTSHNCLEAVELRRNGATYDDILQRVGMAKSTLWRWLKAEGLVDGQSQRYTERRLLAQRKAAKIVHDRRLERTRTVMAEAKGQIGTVTTRELLLIGIALY